MVEQYTRRRPRFQGGEPSRPIHNRRVLRPGRVAEIQVLEEQVHWVEGNQTQYAHLFCSDLLVYPIEEYDNSGYIKEMKNGDIEIAVFQILEKNFEIRGNTEFVPKEDLEEREVQALR